MVKHLASAFPWRKMLGRGAYATVGELGLAEEIDPTDLGRALRLTLLAPDIFEAILDDRLSSEVGLAEIMRYLPAEWGVQKGRLRPYP